MDTKSLPNFLTLYAGGHSSGRLHPILIMPYLNEDKLHRLEQAGLNGVDLCGNGVVNIPGFAWCFVQGGKPLPFSALIKNVYQKNSSMVARVFLDMPRHKSVFNLQLR